MLSPDDRAMSRGDEDPDGDAGDPLGVIGQIIDEMVEGRMDLVQFERALGEIATSIAIFKRYGSVTMPDLHAKLINLPGKPLLRVVENT